MKLKSPLFCDYMKWLFRKKFEEKLIEADLFKVASSNEESEAEKSKIDQEWINLLLNSKFSTKQITKALEKYSLSDSISDSEVEECLRKIEPKLNLIDKPIYENVPVKKKSFAKYAIPCLITCSLTLGLAIPITLLLSNSSTHLNPVEDTIINKEFKFWISVNTHYFDELELKVYYAQKEKINYILFLPLDDFEQELTIDVNNQSINIQEKLSLQTIALPDNASTKYFINYYQQPIEYLFSVPNYISLIFNKYELYRDELIAPDQNSLIYLAHCVL